MKIIRILLFGANGQVGWELRRSLATLGQLKACERKQADFTSLSSLRTLISDYQPAIIVNAAAYTAVDEAESEPHKARQVNVEAVKLLATEAKRLDAWLVHYSTDYVFDGSKVGAYTETDQPNPLSVYGRTKLQGEEVIREIDCKYLIFRTSWVFAARGTNFINTVLRLAKQRKELHIVADQVGSPTSADLIADITSLALYKLIHQEMATEPLTGTYHLAADGNTTWHGLATYVVTQALEFGSGLQTVPATVQPIATSDYPLPANRPANSCFNTEKLNRTFDLKLPPWQDGIDRILGEILNS